MDAESLLGPLPDHWTTQNGRDSGGGYFLQFYDPSTQQVTIEDPRLAAVPIPSEWEQLPAVRTVDDPEFFCRFRNKDSGEIINADPRLLPENLKAQGVDLETFDLV